MSGSRGELHLKSDELWDAARELEPGNSVFVVVVEVEWIEQIQKAAAGYNKLAEHALDSDAAASLGIVVEE